MYNTFKGWTQDRPLGAGELGHTLFRYKQFMLDEMTE